MIGSGEPERRTQKIPFQKEIGTFWTGPKDLHYLNHICLASFVSQGHKVCLYTEPSRVESLVVPQGVSVRSVDTVHEGISRALSRFQPATAADLFRIILIRKRDVIWADTDAYCVKPFVSTDGYLFSSETETPISNHTDGNVNNGVIGLPKCSDALNLLYEYSLNILSLKVSKEVLVIRYIESKIGHPVLRHGPKAFTYFASHTGELKYQSHAGKLYPIHFNLSDCFWDPLIDVYDRVDHDCLSIHLWFSQVRKGWLRRRALKGSFIWKEARKHGINMKRLKY